jgi:hypothetical protein
MNKYLIVGPLLIAIGLATVLLSGCSVNVIVAPHATLAVESGNVRNDAMERQCEATPDLLICNWQPVQ